MMTSVFKLFSELGLSDLESKVYFAGLKLGPSSVQDIARKAGISRTATYDAIAALKEKGLFSTFEKGKRTYFSAEEAGRAVDYFRRRVKNLDLQVDSLEKMVPEINTHAGGEKPTVRFYEGEEAITAVFQDVQSVRPKRLDEVSNMDDVYEHLFDDDGPKPFLSSSRTGLDQVSVPGRMLYTGELRSARENVAVRKMPDGITEFHGNIWIYANRIAFSAFTGKYVSVIIENQQFADTAHALFEGVWVLAERL